VELLTVGAYYKTSSTAFVTMKSRQAAISAHQMFLSHVHYSMVVKAAPNPKGTNCKDFKIGRLRELPYFRV
jgi:hypothetical protein